MTKFIFALGVSMSVLSVSCVSYRIHLSVLPPGAYDVKLDNSVDEGNTNGAGKMDLYLQKVPRSESPKVAVANGGLSGFAVLDADTPVLEEQNVDSLRVTTNAGGERVYDIRFVLDRQLRNNNPDTVSAGQGPGEEIGATPSAPVAVGASRLSVAAASPAPQELRGFNDNPEYARKIATTGATCFFIGMGLNYASAFVPQRINDSTPNIGGMVVALGMGLASAPLEIAGTSYAVGGAKLSWELGGDRCEESREPFTLWRPYKGVWILMAVGGALSVISSLASASDQSAALSLSLISLGLDIGRDVCWSIVNIKALNMTRKEKECLDEQKMPANRMRLELQPYAVRGGGGARCSLLF